MLNHFLTSAPDTSQRTKFYQDNRFVLFLWVLITLIFVIDSWATHRYNNYLIFENTFRNLLQEKSLYAWYPAYHEDANHYGPIFSVLIAPFALLPNWIGLLFWNLFNCFLLFKAVQTLPLSEDKKVMIGYIAIPCLIESMLNQQFNAGAAALMILSYTQINKDKGIWSAFCIVLGTFIKLYGIVGLAFFFFARRKPVFVLWLIMWSIVIFLLPMLFASPDFVAQSYIDWKNSLIGKNMLNVSGGGDISIMGFFRQLLNQPGISNFLFLTIGSLVFMLPFSRTVSFSKARFQLMILSSVMLFPVLFSTGAEDCTFIISIMGVGIWYVKENNKVMKKILLPVLLIITCNFPLLLFPSFAKAHPLWLAIISFPYFLVWLRVINIATRDRLAHEEETEKLTALVD
ncbi:multisubunit Na+/H+ antiporter MnhG subunit [Pedobacter sp. W3I1]|uniref:glycosyltransferase family 87 protein n=1 Tax=Pedobacter sp. W3I1 TaxID=3042291 RepID=UPI00278549C3|nr:glycosyltransferase family 87 protein [Pedobacter sp. W3I1]MDQ0639658.1 multisubunit Na+/H+ antiporter MnhG subunit [Pedobacter sp. W3I1]